MRQQRWGYRLAIGLIVLSVVVYLTGAHLWSAYNEVGAAWIFFGTGAVLQVLSLSLASHLDRERRKGLQRR